MMIGWANKWFIKLQSDFIYKKNGNKTRDERGREREITGSGSSMN